MYLDKALLFTLTDKLSKISAFTLAHNKNLDVYLPIIIVILFLLNNLTLSIQNPIQACAKLFINFPKCPN